MDISNYYAQDLLSFLLLLIGIGLYFSQFSSKTKQIYFLFLIIQGLSIIILNFKIKPYLGIVLFFSGFYLLESSLSEYRNTKKIEAGQSIFVKIFGWDPSLIKYFGYIGAILILIQLISIRYFFNHYLGDIDIWLILVGFLWIIYVYIPPIYSNERDFLFLFINFLYFILITTGLIFSGDFEAKSSWIEIMITKPLVAILQFLGYYVFADANKVYYVSQDSPSLHSVWIAPMCSGIYSIQVFVAALISYLLIFKKRIDLETLILALLGIVVSYIANLLRLVVIILAGHYYGGEALYWTHQNLGWIIFTVWMFLFWSILNLISGPTRNSSVAP